MQVNRDLKCSISNLEIVQLLHALLACFFFFFLLVYLHVEVPGPGIKPALQLWPTPQF